MRRILILCIFAASLGALVWQAVLASGPSGELVTNGGFETGDFTGWIEQVPADPGTFAKFSIDSATKHSGNFSVSQNWSYIANGLGAYIVHSDLIRVLPSRSYTFSYWFKVTLASGVGFGVKVYLYDSNANRLITPFFISAIHSAVQDWTQESVIDVTDVNAAYMSIQIAPENGVSGDFIAYCLDDFSLIGQAPSLAYFPLLSHEP